MHAGIASGESGPVAVHWNAPNGTWLKTTSSNPASPGAPTRKPNSESASAEASAAAGQAPASVLCALHCTSTLRPGFCLAVALTAYVGIEMLRFYALVLFIDRLCILISVWRSQAQLPALPWH